MQYIEFLSKSHDELNPTSNRASIILLPLHVMMMSIFFFINITCHAQWKQGEIYSINIPYLMSTPMGSILAITLMNSQ